MDWLIAEYGFSPTDAYCLVSTCPDFRINVYQMCRIRNLRPVAGAEIPKTYLPREARDERGSAIIGLQSRRLESPARPAGRSGSSAT